MKLECVVTLALGGLLCACNKGADVTSNAAPTPPSAQAPAPAKSPPAPLQPVTMKVPFEGEIVVAVTKEPSSPQIPASLTYDVKGDEVRYAPPGATVRTVADTAKNRAYEISDSRRSYATLEARTAPPSTDANVKITKSEFSQKVAGIRCEDWVVTDADGVVDLCVARGVPFYDLSNTASKAAAEPTWAAVLTREKAFPLSVVAYDKHGNREYDAEATKVDARKLEDSLFQVPPGFKQTDPSPDLRTASLP